MIERVAFVVRLDRDVYDLICAEAYDRRVPMAAIIREALRAHLQPPPPERPR